LSPTRTDGKSRRSVRSRAGIALLAGFVLLSTAGCSTEDLPRFGWPTAAATETERSLWLWQTLWVAAFIIGGITLILILWPAVFHRRKRMGEIPAQLRYNMPIEILYTAVPLVIVAVIFGYTARDQAEITKLSDNPPNTINVVGYQWNWTFNYMNEGTYDIGTPDTPAVLYLPVNETTRFDLTSPDVIHSFWVPSFLFKMDVIPGRTNQFELTPDRVGTFKGKCAELCGVDHARMLFDVKVVERAEYEAHLAERKAAGAEGILVTGRSNDNADGKQGRTEINRDPNYRPSAPTASPTAASGSQQ
jgi:cytochrome c oxidase subunit II